MKYLNEYYNKKKLQDFLECKDYLLETINGFLAIQISLGRC